jgi:hypothetical protein
VRVSDTRSALAGDRLTQLRADLGGMRASRTHRTYGPRTRRDFLALLARERV